MFSSLSLPAVEAAVIAAPIRDLTSILVAGLIAIALIARAPAARWTSLIFALLIAPLLLAGAVLEDDRVNSALDRPVLLLAGGAVALVGLAVAVFVLQKWPKLLPVLLAVAIPLRLPIAIGGESVNLLLPLYALIGAGVVAFAVRARRRGKELARSWDMRQGPSAGSVIAEAWTARSLSGAAAAVPVLLAASVAMYALRIPFSIDADRGVQTLCFFLVPFAALFLLLREIHWDTAQLRRVAIALVVLALVAVAAGDYEYITGRVLWHQNVLDESTLNATIRVNSLFFDPNIYGRFLMVILLGVLTALVWGARGVGRIAGLAVLFAVVWAGLFVTYSQSSMLGLLVGAIVLMGLRFGPRKAGLVGGALVLAGVIAVVAFGGYLRVNTSTSEGLDVASAGRWALIKGGVELVKDKPVFGWGSGGYRSAYRQQADENAPGTVAASHTIPITVAAEQGLVGLLVYIALIAAAAVALLRRASRSLSSAFIGAAFIGLVIHSWLYAAFLEDPLLWALLAIGLCLGAEGEHDERVETEGGGSPAAPAPHTPHDVVGPVTLVGVGEGKGPGATVGESGGLPDALDGGHGHTPPGGAGPASVSTGPGGSGPASASTGPGGSVAGGPPPSPTT
ncbi:MAG: O-antigen ligase family protein [Solirubrobacteraceae bacterium]|nr:O-antigen ligase family protein [Solirubrobacteraceae bacterium]